MSQKPGWTVIIPVKPWRLAKSRLSMPMAVREALVRSFALHVLETVQRSSLVDRVVVVTAELELSVYGATAEHVTVLQDRPMLVPDPLNSAVAQGRWWAQRSAPDAPVVVIPADLAALTTRTLDSALRELGQHARAHIADWRGSGTTLLAAASPELLEPKYGAGSARAHAHSGSAQIYDVDPRLQLDVDDVEDLHEAKRLGLAPRAAAVATAYGAAARAPLGGAAARRSVALGAPN